jgi:SAM-dependent methyltransferase
VGRFTSSLKSVIPSFALDAYRRLRLEHMHRRNRNRTAEAVFTEIYENNLWGGGRGPYCSGAGSRDAAVVGPYVACMKRELQRIGSPSMTVVDLGCGDYTIGRQLSPMCGRYVGVDVVRDLVAYNNDKFANELISFRHLDIVNEELPDGDVCLVRQVLQHLSNDQICKVLPKLDKYIFSFVTEHHPSPHRLTVENLDKPHGADIRVNLGSGVFLDAPPFSAERALRLLLEVPGHAGPDALDPGVIRTFVLKPKTQPQCSSARSRGL